MALRGVHPHPLSRTPTMAHRRAWRAAANPFDVPLQVLSALRWGSSLGSCPFGGPSPGLRAHSGPRWPGLVSGSRPAVDRPAAIRQSKPGPPRAELLTDRASAEKQVRSAAMAADRPPLRPAPVRYSVDVADSSHPLGLRARDRSSGACRPPRGGQLPARTAGSSEPIPSAVGAVHGALAAWRD